MFIVLAQGVLPRGAVLSAQNPIQYRSVQSNAPEVFLETPTSSKFALWLTRLYAPLLLAACAVQAWWPLREVDDFWAHAAIGRWIWQHHQVPHQSLFVWGRAPIDWIYHSWLSQLSFFVLLETGGPMAIAIFTVALSCLPFWLLWRKHSQCGVRNAGCGISEAVDVTPHSALRTPHCNGDFAPFVFVLAIWCSAPRFRPRPELFTALFLTLLLLFLIQWSRRPLHEKPLHTLQRDKWGILILPALFVLWANFHGAVALGLAVLFLTAFCDLLQDRGAGRARAFFLIALLCAAAIWLNPFGLEYARALKPVGGAMFSAIDEWKPFWKSPVMPWEYVAGEAALVLLALLAWWQSAQRRWSQVAWLFLMAAAFVDARRNLWMLAIVCLAVMAASAPQWNALRLGAWICRARGQFSLRAPPPVQCVLAAAPLLFLMIMLGAAARGKSWPPRAISSRVPLKAARFVAQRKIKTRLFTDYESSSYWQWRLHGHPPLFIDLLNAYPDDLMTDYLQIARASPRGRRLLDALRVNTVILRRRGPNEGIALLADYLNKNKGWKRIYDGRDATIWQRSGKL